MIVILLVLFLLVVTVGVGFAVNNATRHAMEIEAIDAGVGHYDPLTKEFSFGENDEDVHIQRMSEELDDTYNKMNAAEDRADTLERKLKKCKCKAGKKGK